VILVSSLTGLEFLGLLGSWHLDHLHISTTSTTSTISELDLISTHLFIFGNPTTISGISIISTSSSSLEPCHMVHLRHLDNLYISTIISELKSRVVSIVFWLALLNLNLEFELEIRSRIGSTIAALIGSLVGSLIRSQSDPDRTRIVSIRQLARLNARPSTISLITPGSPPCCPRIPPFDNPSTRHLFTRCAVNPPRSPPAEAEQATPSVLPPVTTPPPYPESTPPSNPEPNEVVQPPEENPSSIGSFIPVGVGLETPEARAREAGGKRRRKGGWRRGW